MKKIQKIVVFIGLVMLFAACKPDLDVYDDYRDISFAYGVFDTDETTHYFKIYKGFQTEMSIYDYARQVEWNKLYFDSLEVYLEERVNNVVRRTYPFDITSEIPKDSGVFPSPMQILYKNRTPLTLNTTSTYRFVIKNKYTQQEQPPYAETKMVGELNVTAPFSTNNLDLTQNRGTSCSFTNPVNGSAFEIYQVFHYMEVNKNTHQIEKKSVKRLIGSDFCQPGTNSQVTHRINQIYYLIGEQLVVNENVDRYIDSYGCIDYEVWVCGSSLATYMKLNDLNTPLLGNKINYSNFVSEDHNAFGIFSSRHSGIRTYVIDNKSEDSLVKGQYTKHLGFKKLIDYVP